jgi:hypothetical protein
MWTMRCKSMGRKDLDAVGLGDCGTKTGSLGGTSRYNMPHLATGHKKRAITIMPSRLFAPPQTLIPQQVTQTQNVAGQPTMTGLGRGRPTGPSAPGAAPSQTGVPGQPSAVAQLGGQTSTPQTKGFGNTPTHSQSSKSHQSTTSTAKSASKKGAIMSFTPYMTSAKMQSIAPPLSSNAWKYANSPSSDVIYPKMAFYRLGQMVGSLRVQLNSEKRAVSSALGTGLGAGLGALSAPSGHGGEGALRGMGRAGGTFAGLGLGGGVGALGGYGLGASLGGLAGYVGGLSPHDIAATARDAAGLGMLGGGAAGGLYGGVKGYQEAGKYMGPASYDPANKSKPKSTSKPKEEKKTEKKSFIESIGQGAGLEGAKAMSKGLDDSKVKERALRGMLHGPLGALGLGLGAGLGGLAGGGLGALAGAGAGALTGNPGLGATGAMAGTGLGGAAGMYYGGREGGRLGYNLFRHGKEEDGEETDMAKGEAEKEDKHG